MNNKLKLVINEIAGTPVLRNLTIISVIIILAYPFFIWLFIFPSFSQILVSITEKDAIKTANHMMDSLMKENHLISIEKITSDFETEISVLVETYQIEKIKLFTDSGEVIYSTSSEDIGKINQHDYFFDIVAKGGIYTKLVQNGKPTLEGRTIQTSVVETYVPIMKNNKLLGAFEIYYEITDKLSVYNQLKVRLLLFLAAGMSLLVIVFAIVIGNASLLMIKRRQAEEKAQKSEKKYDTIFHKSPVPTFIAQNGRTKFFNNAKRKLMGYDENGIDEIDFANSVHPDDLGMIQERNRMRQKGEPVDKKYSYRIISKEGDIRWVENRVELFEWDEKPATLCFQIDITERRNAEIKIREQNNLLEKANHQINNELEQARLAQQGLLPRETPEVKNLRLATKYSPMAQIGGDFYDFFTIDKENLGIIVGDVTGHGIPAALLSFLFMSTLRNNRLNGSSPDVLLNRTNTLLAGNLPSGKYASIFYCTYNQNSRVLRYASAGHPPGLLIRPSSNEIIHLQTKGTVVGIFENPAIPFEYKEIPLYIGDKLLLYTDGIIEISDKNKKMLDSSTFETFLNSKTQLTIDQLLEDIYKFCMDFSDHQVFEDDITMVGMEVM